MDPRRSTGMVRCKAIFFAIGDPPAAHVFVHLGGGRESRAHVGARGRVSGCSKTKGVRGSRSGGEGSERSVHPRCSTPARSRCVSASVRVA
jgi:hypothetical protein